MNYVLISDVISTVKRGFCYAKAGEEVKIIDESYPVVIVEIGSGNRFATRKDNLKEKIQ